MNGEEPGAIGARWGEETAFAVLDIYARSKYHNVEELQKLTDNLAAVVGLSRAVYRSSVSGGWHLYLFLDRWANCLEIEETLKRLLYSLGYEIRGGTLEIFPSGNGLRIPLQPGFGWLNDRGELVTAREELNSDDAISAFLTDFAKYKNNWSAAKDRIDTRLDAIDRAKKFGAQEQRDRLSANDFEPLYGYRRIEEEYREGRRYWQTRLTAKGQRHDAILAVDHYLWHGDHSAAVPAMAGEHNDDPRHRLILAWLEKNHNGYCNHISRGRWHKVEAQIKRAVKWRR